MAQAQPGRPEAAAAIWSWRPAGAASHPATGPIRLRGALQATAGLTVAGALAWFGHRTPAVVVGAIASVIGLSALVSPLGVFAAIEHAFTVLGTWFGKALTWLVLPMIFYAFFVPFGALFRRGRRDSMRRYFDRETPTYWTTRGTRDARSGSPSHERQY